MDETSGYEYTTSPMDALGQWKMQELGRPRKEGSGVECECLPPADDLRQSLLLWWADKVASGRNAGSSGHTAVEEAPVQRDDDCVDVDESSQAVSDSASTLWSFNGIYSLLEIVDVVEPLEAAHYFDMWMANGNVGSAEITSDYGSLATSLPGITRRRRLLLTDGAEATTEGGKGGEVPPIVRGILSAPGSTHSIQTGGMRHVRFAPDVQTPPRGRTERGHS